MGVERNGKEKPVRKRKSDRAGSSYAEKALVIGLTGGIATGKTTVARMFKDLGAKVLSADEVVHRMLQPGSDVWRRVVREFGESVLDESGNVDRGRLADIVFRDPDKRSRLEAIMHPPVLESLDIEAKRFRKSGEGVLILEIPLLVETSCLYLVDKVLVVTAEQDTQIKRLEKRYGISSEDASLRIASQLPMSEKLRHADWVVSTEGTFGSTKAQVRKVWRAIQKSLARAG